MERNETWRFRVSGFLGIKMAGGLSFGINTSIQRYQTRLLCLLLYFFIYLVIYLLDHGGKRKEWERGEGGQ